MKAHSLSGRSVAAAAALLLTLAAAAALRSAPALSQTPLADEGADVARPANALPAGDASPAFRSTADEPAPVAGRVGARIPSTVSAAKSADFG